jgi:hypothetical protein
MPYEFHSIDPKDFDKLIGGPTKKQLTLIAEFLAMGLDVFAPSFPKKDPVLDWPNDLAALADLAKSRLALDDWYTDLSFSERAVWQLGFYNPIDKLVKVRGEAGCDYALIDLVQETLGVPRNKVVDKIMMSGFGVRPFRCTAKAATPKPNRSWVPPHSIHLPTELEQLQSELSTTADAIRATRDRQIISEFNDELMPTLAKLIKQKRILFVHVNT